MNELNSLYKMYRISSPSKKEDFMVDFIEDELNALGAVTWRDTTNNLYATKGVSDTYPCIVAHTDEVHTSKGKGFKVFNASGMVFGIDTATQTFSGIGADDKNGIWIALQAFEKYDAVKGAFFVSEEIGCVGSSLADMEFFDDCRFVLQCDRRGNSDFVTKISQVPLCSDKFIEDAGLELFGYEEASGMMTDVVELKQNGLAVSCCNISCGYYDPHTDNEYTVIKDLLNCRDLVFNIIDNCVDVYTHEYTYYIPKYNASPKSYKSYYDNYYDNYYDDAYNRGWGTAEYEYNYSDQYEALLNEMEEIYAVSPEATLREIFEVLKEEYYMLTKYDFSEIYSDITGNYVSLHG